MSSGDVLSAGGPAVTPSGATNHTDGRLGRNVSALVSAQAVTWTTGLMAAVIIPRALGPSAVGTLVAAASVAGILGLIVGFVTVNYLIRAMVARPDDAPAIAAAAIAIRLALIPIFVVAMVAYSRLLGLGGEKSLVFLLIALAAAVNLLAEPILAVFQASQRMEYLALTSVISQSSQGVVGIVLVLMGFKIAGIAGASVVVALVSLLLDIRWSRSCLPIQRRTSLSDVRTVARGSLPYFASGFAFLIYTWIDVVILSLLVPARVVGWYGVPTRLFATLLFVPTILGTAWFPRLVGAFESDPKSLGQEARRNVELVLLLSVPICAATAVGARPVIHLLYGPAYDGAIPVMVVLGFCLVPMYLGITFGQMLVASKRPSVLTALLVVGSAANAGLNLLLIPYFQTRYRNGAVGSALSLLATEVLITSAGFALVGRGVLGRAEIGRLAKTSAATVLMVGVAYLLRPWGVPGLVLAGVTFVAAALLMRILTPEEWAMTRHVFGRVRRRLPSGSRSADPDPSGVPGPGGPAPEPVHATAPGPGAGDAPVGAGVAAPAPAGASTSLDVESRAGGGDEGRLAPRVFAVAEAQRVVTGVLEALVADASGRTPGGSALCRASGEFEAGHPLHGLAERLTAIERKYLALLSPHRHDDLPDPRAAGLRRPPPRKEPVR